MMLVCVVQHLCMNMLAFTHAFSHTSLGQYANLSPHHGIMSLGFFVNLVCYLTSICGYVCHNKPLGASSSHDP
jgi:hypothetical protein